MELLLLAAKKPEIPMLISIAMYLWTALATWMLGHVGLTVMWVNYALANGALLYHTKYELQKHGPLY